MSKEDRKKREKERRRNRIIDAAENVIFSKGIEQATMEEIAREAELSKGTLYLYFKNKSELYMGICERGSNMLNDQFSTLFAEEYSGLELIQKMGATYLNFVRENPNYFNAFVHYESMVDAEEIQNSEMAQSCERNLKQAMHFMVRSLQVGMQDGTVDDSYNPKELAVMLWAGTRGIGMIHHMKEKGHHYEVVDEMDINITTLFDNFLTLLSEGMASKEMKNNK